MCEEFGPEEILDHLQGRLAPERESRLREHLPGCPDCRAAEEDLRGVARLSESPVIQPRPEVDRAIRIAIGEEASRRREAAREPIRFPFIRRSRRRPEAVPALGLIISAAAAVLLAVTTYVLATRKPRPHPGAVPVAAQTPSEPAFPTPESQPPPHEPPPDIETPPPVVQQPAPAVRPPAEPAPIPPAPAPKPPERPSPEPPAAPAIPTIVEPRIPAPRIAVVAAVEGRIERAGAAAAEGTFVSGGEPVLCRTGTAMLDLVDGSRMALRADTLLAIETRQEGIIVRLARGEVACRVTRREDRFSVETPHGTAVVKGTVFSVRAGMLSTAVTVAEGRVEARNTRGAVLVPMGFQSSMNGGAPSKPQPADPARSMAWAFRQGLRARGAIWIPAASPKAKFHPPMTAGRHYAEGSLTGVAVFSPSKTYTVNGRADGGWVAYTVEIPQDGDWFLWGRFYYPGKGGQVRRMPDGGDNDPNSFWVSVDGGDEMEFGNLKYDPATGQSYFQRWHWDGDGTVEVGKPSPLHLGRLTRGIHTIRVRERESFEDGELRLAPRLDMLCLTPDRDYVPHDEDVRR